MEPTILVGDVLWLDKASYGARLPQRWGDIPIINIFTWIKPLRDADEKVDWGYRRLFGWKEPKCGDMVVFNSSEDAQVLLVKRIIKIYSTLTSNGKEQHFYFMEGDNKENSHDSRAYGYVPESAILGKVNYVLFSVDRDKKWNEALRTNRFFKKLH